MTCGSIRSLLRIVALHGSWLSYQHAVRMQSHSGEVGASLHQRSGDARATIGQQAKTMKRVLSVGTRDATVGTTFIRAVLSEVHGQ